MADQTQGFLAQPGFADAVRSVMKDLLALPTEFMDYTVQYGAVNPLPIPLSQVTGYVSNTQTTRIHRTATQSIANGTYTAISWDTEDFDFGSLHSTVTNPERITIQLPGKYLVGGNLIFDFNATGSRVIYLCKNGTTPFTNQVGSASAPSAGSVFTTDLTITTVLDLVAGDYLTMVAYQNSGGALNVGGDVRNTLWVIRVSS